AGRSRTPRRPTSCSPASTSPPRRPSRSASSATSSPTARPTPRPRRSPASSARTARWRSRPSCAPCTRPTACSRARPWPTSRSTAWPCSAPTTPRKAPAPSPRSARPTSSASSAPSDELATFDRVYAVKHGEFAQGSGQTAQDGFGVGAEGGSGAGGPAGAAEAVGGAGDAELAEGGVVDGLPVADRLEVGVGRQVGGGVDGGDGDAAALALDEQVGLIEAAGEVLGPQVDGLGRADAGDDVVEGRVAGGLVARRLDDPLRQRRPVRGLQGDETHPAVARRVQPPRADGGAAVAIAPAG